MAYQPSDDRDPYDSFGEQTDRQPQYSDEPAVSDAYGDYGSGADEPPRRRPLASHHRSHRSHHSGSGSSQDRRYDDYGSSDYHRHSSSDRRYDDYGEGSYHRHSSSDRRYDDYGDSSYHRHSSSDRRYDDYGDSSHHHHSSSHRHYADDGDSSYNSVKKPGRLASHHRTHHHHHTSSRQPDPNYVSSMETMSVDLDQNRQDTAASRMAGPDYRTEYTKPEDTYYADYTGSDDARYADRTRPEDTYYVDSVTTEDTWHSDRTPVPPVGEQDRAPGPLASTIASASAINPPRTYSASAVESSNSRRRKRQIKKRKTVLGILIRILLVLILLIVAGIGGLVYLRARGQESMTHEAEEVSLTMAEENTPDAVEEIEDDGKTITYKGEKYRWNDSISTILFLGSDRTVEQQEERESVIGTNGQADTILLGVIDNANKKISFINVNRDTMSSVSQYTPDGDYAGEKQMQICLAYSYGKDNEEGCKLMASAVSNFLYGIPVDSYARISYDAVPMLNDSVGGVTVNILEDMTSVDPAFVKGETVTLVGNQALRYIRSRDHSVTETNELRMARQKQYFYAFTQRAIEATRADLTLPLGLYNNAKPYMTTSITPSQVTYLTSKVLEYGFSGEAIHSVPGESVDGESGLVEFHADDGRLYEMILETFYNKVE